MTSSEASGQTPLLVVQRSVTEVPAATPVTVVVGEDGAVIVARHNYALEYSDSGRTIIPKIEFPYGEQGLETGSSLPLQTLAVRDVEDGLMLAGIDNSGQAHAIRYSREEDFMTGEVILEPEQFTMPLLPALLQLEISPDLRNLFALSFLTFAIKVHTIITIALRSISR